MKRLFRNIAIFLLLTATLSFGLLWLDPSIPVRLFLKWREAISAATADEQKRNLETNEIRIELDGRHYNIPLRYTYGQAFEKYGRWPSAKRERVKVKAITISVLLPDLKPYFPEDEARWKVRGHGERAEITISDSSTRPMNWYKSLRERYTGGKEERRFIQGGMENGLMIFSGKGPWDNNYIPEGSSPELLISCRKEPKSADYFPSCQIDSNYHPGIFLSYWYSTDYFAQWAENDSKIKQLFDQFESAAQSERKRSSD